MAYKRLALCLKEVNFECNFDGFCFRSTFLKCVYNTESFGFSLWSLESVRKFYGGIQDQKKRERLPKPKTFIPVILFF